MSILISTAGFVIGVGLLNLISWAFGSSQRFGWYDKKDYNK